LSYNGAVSTAIALQTGEQEQYRTHGFIVVKSLFSKQEAQSFVAHYMAMHAAGTAPGESNDYIPDHDPLKTYPRFMHPHRWDSISLAWLTDPRIMDRVAALLGEEPAAAQSMMYFKAPGARGQALHQDQFYLRVTPGTCMGVWIALDPADEENGCMQVVPLTGGLPRLCTVPADTTVSISDVTVPLSEEMHAVPVVMQPGDALFFNGSVIHGSYPNTSASRFRRCLIGHYLPLKSASVSQWYNPLVRRDGTNLDLPASEGGGPCGVWTEQNQVQLVDPQTHEPIPEPE